MKLYSLHILNILVVLVVSKTFAIEQIHPDVRRFAEQREQIPLPVQLLVAALNSMPQHQPHAPLAAQSNPVYIPASQQESIPLPAHIPRAPARVVLRMPRIVYDTAITSITVPLLLGSGLALSKYRVNENVVLSCSLFPITAAYLSLLFFNSRQPTIDIPLGQSLAAYVSLMALNTMIWSYNSFK